MAGLPVPLEEVEQRVVVQYLQLLESQGKVLWFSSVPNSTFTKSWSVKRKNKEQGLRPGMTDLIVIFSDNVLFLEMKRIKGGVLSAAQKTCIAALESAGQIVCIAKGADEAIKSIDQMKG